MKPASQMTTSDRGIAQLVSEEGIIPAPYYDSENVLTFGIGHTKAAGGLDPARIPVGMPRDLDAALDTVFKVFVTDLPKYEAGVRKALGDMPVSQSQFDAAVSFHYNTGAIGRANWVDAWVAGDAIRAADMIMNWSKPAAIIPRRENEQTLFRTGHYSGHAATVWGVSGYNVVWRPIRQLSAKEIIEYVVDARGTGAVPAPEEYKMLRRGMRGDPVATAQLLLRQHGFDPVWIDNHFGKKTEDATRRFQPSRQLKADGIIGPKTWAALLGKA